MVQGARSDGELAIQITARVQFQGKYSHLSVVLPPHAIPSVSAQSHFRFMPLTRHISAPRELLQREPVDLHRAKCRDAVLTRHFQRDALACIAVCTLRKNWGIITTRIALRYHFACAALRLQGDRRQSCRVRSRCTLQIINSNGSSCLKAPSQVKAPFRVRATSCSATQACISDLTLG